MTRDSGLGVRDSELVDQARQTIERALSSAQTPCITSSFQAECVVLTHMLREVRPDIPVLFLDTFHHFAQTLAYRDELSERWGLNLINLRAQTPSVGLWQAESTGVLQASQGGAAVLGAGRLRHLVHGAASRSVAVTREPERSGAVQAPRKDHLPRRADRWLDRTRRVGVREGARHSTATAVRTGLHEHRLRAVHETAVRSGEPALGPLAGPEARVRNPHSG